MDLADSPRGDALDQPALRRELDEARAEIERLRGELSDAQRLLSESERLADRDALTPILNRRAFMRELSRTIAFCTRYDTSASVVFFDMDGFKAVNDLYGHAGGDAALLWVAKTLHEHVRESDVVGRIGGDEFAVILVQTEQRHAESKAAELQRLIEAEPMVFHGRAVPLRISYGVRAFEPGLDPARMLAEADAAMFVRKGGRI